ncbi:unnamed protein product [Diatraea saccharalis]|uniref:Uncharacterized protein n=1 Tax=Diatraea saccharalis TaxID=40085 RepID=A0A9N9RDG0_9NEOP|nr:unnamed protein product [Diatraea saccharalis]
MCLKYFLVLFLTGTCIRLSYSVSFQNVIQSKHRIAFGDQLSVQKDDLRSNKIFEDFLRNLLTLLSTGFPKKKLSNYCRLLKNEVDALGFKFTRKLARHLRDLSKLDRDEIQEVLASYVEEMDKPLDHRRKFLDAMNKVFTLQHDVIFRDYIFDVRDYGNEDILFIHDETQKVLKTIVNSIMEISKKDRNNLESEMKKAIKEYNKY